MSFRRMPFQFTTTDPVDRQRELERRFGLPASRNMFVDVPVPNPLRTGAVPQESSTSSSPRLQHRVPIFRDGHDQPIHSSVDSIGSYPENKKPKVRVIPIEVEGAETRPVRLRTFSGPATSIDDSCEGKLPDGNEASLLKHSMTDLTRPSKIRNIAGPRVHNIPIHFEGSKNTVNNANSEKLNKSPKNNSEVNGCTVTKSVKSPGKENKAKEVRKLSLEDLQKEGIENSLKKIENVLKELKTYEAEVQEFSGSLTDKKYKYLDEMLTRCMIKLDDVDTMGNENVRTARKRAVKKVQAQIDLLESKVNAENLFKATSVNEIQMVTSEIISTLVGEISSDKSDQQNEEVCESLNKKNQATEDKKQLTINDEMERQLDTDMTKSETVVEQIKEDIERQLDAEMTECEAEDKANSENIENQHNAENVVNLYDATMSEEPGNQLEAEIVEKSNNEAETEGPVIAENQVNTEESGNVHTVKMAEINESSLVQDINLKHPEIEEVEMTEKDVEVKTDLLDKDHLNSQEAGNEQGMNSEDVEMSDIQNFLDYTKEHIPEETTIQSTSSQSKENEADKNLENNAVNFIETSCTSSNVDSQHKCESNLTDNRQLVSEIVNVDNSLYKSN